MKTLSFKKFRRKLGFHQDGAYIAGNAVYFLRMKLRLTQEQFAKMVGSHQSAICRAENEGCSVEFLEKIAKKTKKELVIEFKD